jgi:hypothetical protein
MNLINVTEKQVQDAARAAGLTADQSLVLLAALQRAATDNPSAAVTAGLRFDLTHLLWYGGALIVLGSMGLFSTLAFSQMGGAALTLTAIVYAAVFTAIGHHIWHRRKLTTPGGLLIAVAVGMVPLAVYGIQDMAGVWDTAGQHTAYRDYYIWIKASWVPMEIATIVTGVLAFVFYRFSFILAIVGSALWFLSMDLAPWIVGADDLSFELRRKVSFCFGIAVLLVAWAVDVTRDRDVDSAFWLHVAGVAAFWGGLTFAPSSSEIGKALYCAVNIGLVLLSVYLRRRIYAVFGVIGIAVYLGHLAEKVFKDSLLFPFALSLVGVAVIALGLHLHSRRQAFSAYLDENLPAVLKRIRPPHASLSMEQP